MTSLLVHDSSANVSVVSLNRKFVNIWVPSFMNSIMSNVVTGTSSRLAVFLGKVVLKICSQLTGEHPRRSAISIKLCNFIEIAFRHECFPVNLMDIFGTHFLQNTSGWLLLGKVPLKVNCFKNIKFVELLIFSSLSKWLLVLFWTISVKHFCGRLYCFQFCSGIHKTLILNSLTFSSRVLVCVVLFLINPFYANVPFLYPLKTPEDLSASMPPENIRKTPVFW